MPNCLVVKLTLKFEYGHPWSLRISHDKLVNGDHFGHKSRLYKSQFVFCCHFKGILSSCKTSQRTYSFWLKDISTPDFSTPSFNPRPFNSGLFNHELFNPGLFNPRLLNPGLFNPNYGVVKSGVGKFMVEKSRVEKSGFEKSGVEMSSFTSEGLN